MSHRLLRAARTLPELWLVLGLSLIHWAWLGVVPAGWRASLGWAIHPYQLFATFVSLGQFMLAGAMFMRWRRMGGSWLTRLPTMFGLAVGLWGIPGLGVAASARFPIEVVIISGAVLTALLAALAFIRELRFPATLSAEQSAADEGRADFGVSFNRPLAVVGLITLGVMIFISLNAPVSNDDNLQLMYAQDNLLVPRINEFEPVFGADIRPTTRGSLTTWPVNLAIFPYLNGLPPQASFWLMRTFLVALNLLAVYTLALRLWGQRNLALLTAILYSLIAVIYTADLDGIGFGMFGRTMQDKFVVRYTLFPVALAWSMAYFQKPDWRKYWMAGLITLGEGATHPMGAVLLGIPLAGVGGMYVLMNLRGLGKGLKPLVGSRGLHAAWQSVKNFLRANWPVWRPFIFLSVFSLISVALPLAARASPDAPVVAYSLTDTRDPSLFYRVNLAVNNYRLLINDAFGTEKYIVHPRVFLTTIILLPLALLPFLGSARFNGNNADSQTERNTASFTVAPKMSVFYSVRDSPLPQNLNTALFIGTYILNPIILLAPAIIQRIGEGATPWLLYRFAWPLSLLGPLLLGWALWNGLVWVGARLPWKVARGAWPATAMLAVALGLSKPVYDGLVFLQQVRVDPTASRCRSLQPLFTRLTASVGAGAVVLSTVDIDLCLPASVANAWPVEYGLSSTVNRFPQSRLAEGERRFADSHEFVSARVVDQNLMDILARWNVGLLLLRQDHPLIAQLDHLPELFRLEFQADRYRVYQVLPGAGVNILPDAPPAERWKQARWEGSHPLVEANALWANGQWEEAIAAYKPLTAPDQPAPTRFLAYIGLGRAHQSAGRLAEAVAAFEAALAIDEADAQAWILLGQALQLKNDSEATALAAQRAIELMDWHPKAWQLLGDARRRAGQVAEARTAYERSIAAEYAPGSGLYQRALGTLYDAMQWEDEALTAYRASLAVRETVVAYFFSANIYLERGDYAAAEALAREAHALEFWSDLPYLIWARSAVEQDRLDDGLSFYQQAVFRNPQSGAVAARAATLTTARGAEAALQATQDGVGYQLGFASSLLTAAQSQLALGDVEGALQSGLAAWDWNPLEGSEAVFVGNVYQLLGRNAEATHYFREALEVSESQTGAYLGLSSLARAASPGQWGSATGWAWAAMTASPYNSAAVTTLAEVQAQGGNFLGAIDLYQQAATLDPSSPAPYIGLGNLYRNLATLSPKHPGCMPATCAEFFFQKALALNPRDSAPYLGLGNLALDEGRLEEAILNFETATQLTPYDGAMWIALGRAYQQAARFEEAEWALQTAITNDRGLISGYNALGQFYVTRARREEAELIYTQAVDALAWQPDGYVALGGLLEQGGEAQAARVQYERATLLEPRQAAAALAALGQFYQRQGNYAEAENYLLQASAVDANWLLALGQMYVAAGQRAEARAHYALALARLPVVGQSAANVLLARLSLAEGQAAQAIEEARVAVKLAPINVTAYAILARAYLVSGQPALAVQTYKNLRVALPGSPEVYIAYGNFLRLRGEWSAALRAYEQARDLAPGEAQAWVGLGDMYRSRGEIDQAIESYERAVAVEPSNITALTRLGLAYQALARFDEAIVLFQQAVEQDYTNAEALLNLAALYTQRNQWADAIATYERVLMLLPTDPTAYLALGNLYWARGEAARAMNYLERAVEVAPASGAAWEALGNAHERAGQNLAARMAFEKAIAVEPGYASAYSSLGLWHWRMGHWPEAEKAFRNGLLADASAPEAYLNLAWLMQARGQFTLAEAELKKALTLNPGEADLLMGLGNYYSARGQSALALNMFEQAVELEAGEANHTLILAAAYFDAGRVDEARELYEQAQRLEPTSGETYLALGNFLRWAGEFDGAESMFAAGIEVDPNGLGNYLVLASLYAQLNKVQKAEATYALAVSTHPGSAEAYSAQANFLRQRGEWDAALKIYWQATQLEPGAARPWLALGAGYAARAQFAEARVAYQTALRLEPTNPDAHLALGLLYQNLADVERAELAFNTAAQWDWSRNEAWLSLGNLAQQQGQWAVASEHFQHAITIWPTDPLAHIAAGQAWLGQGQTAEALTEFETATDVAPMSGEAWSALGTARQETLDVAGAQIAFEKAIAVEPGFINAYIDLALLQKSRGQADEAMRTLESAIAFNPADPASHINLGQFLLAEAEFELAATHFEMAVNVAPASGLAHTALGNFYWARNQPTAALSATLEAMAVDPGYLGAYTRLNDTPRLLYPLAGLAQMYSARAEFEQAEKILLTAQTIGPASADVYLGLAQLYLGRNQLEEAEATLLAGQRVAPATTTLYLAQSDVALARGDTTQAMDYLDQARAIEPTAPETWLALADIYATRARFAESIEAYKQASALAPADPRPPLKLADLYLLRGQSALALESAQTALTLDPNSANAYIMLGNYYQQTGQPRVAQSHYLTATVLEPASANAFSALGQNYRVLGQWQQAEVTYQQGIAVAPLGTRNYLNLATLYLNSGLNGSAIKTLLAASEVAPASGEVWGALGNVYLASGNSGAATAAYAEGMKVAPTVDGNYLGFGQWQMTQGRWASAEQTFRAGLGVLPTSGGLYNALATLKYRQGDVASARRYYQNAIAFNPTAVQNYVDYGQMLMTLGESNNAQQQYQAALGINPHATTAWAGLGRVYQNRGQFTEAINAYEAALTHEAQLAPYPKVLFDAYNGLAEIYTYLGQPDAALAIYQSAAGASPGASLPQHYIAQAYRARGDLTTAIIHYRRAVALEGGAITSRVALAAMYQLQGDWAAAKAEYERAIAIRPASAEAYLGLGQGYLAQGYLDLARQAYEHATELAPTSTAPWLALGAWAQARGDLASAQNYYQTAIATDARSAEAYLASGRVSEQQGNPAAAYDMYSRAAQADASLADPWLLRGLLSLSMPIVFNDPAAAAESDYRQALIVQPGNPDARVQLANLYLRQNAFEAAHSEIDAGLNLAPGYSPLYVVTGHWWDRQSRFDEAIVAFEKGAQFDSTNLNAYNSLANVFDHYSLYVNPLCVTLPLTGEVRCAVLNPDAPSALPDRAVYYEGQSQSSPGSIWLHGLLGAFYQESIIYDASAAARHLETLVVRYPEFPDYHRQLAELYEKLNRPTEAVRQWNLYLSLSVAYSNRETAQVHLTPLQFIIAPVTVEAWNPIISIHGSAAIQNFQSYQLDYARADDPNNWHRIAGPLFTPVYNDTLAEWDTAGLPGGTYRLRLTATDTFGFQSWYFVEVTIE